MTPIPQHPELLLRERAWLRSLARQLVRLHESADELAHDALAAAVMQAAPLHAGPRGWLAAILEKQLAGRRRAERRRREREALAALPEAQPPVLDTVAQFEVQRDVANAVLALPEPYRTTVLLRFWDGLSPAAIGKRMGVPVETARTRLKRGLAQLRERLDRCHGGDRAAWVVPLLATMRPLQSFASMAITGVLLMTFTQKLIAFLVVAAAALFVTLATGWAPLPQVPPASLVEAPAPAEATGSLATLPQVASTTNERIAMPAATSDVRLIATGTVVDDATGAPLSGVPVQLVGWTEPESGDPAGTTAGDGRFALRDARDPTDNGRQVVVRNTDYAVARANVPLQRDRQGLLEIDVGTIRLVRGTEFAGQVVDPEGRPVAEARLLLPQLYIHYSSAGPENMLEHAELRGRGDGDGRFRLELPVAPDIAHGNLLFAVAPQGIGWCRIEPSGQRRQVTDLVIRLRPNGAVAVLVMTPDGRPCPSAVVRALPRFAPLGIERADLRQEVSRDDGIRARFAGRTNASGELLLPQLPIGDADARFGSGNERRYDLWVEVTGYPEQPLLPFEVQTGTVPRVVVRLVAAREIGVAIEVRDDLGTPIGDALVEANGERQAQARTDAAGHAVLAVLATTHLTIGARATGHRSAYEKIDLTTAAAPPRVTLVLARTRRLVGRIVDQFGAAAAGLYLFVEGKNVGVADAHGDFEVAHFPMGPRRLLAVLPPDADRSVWTGKQSPELVDAAQGPVTIVLQRVPGSTDVVCTIVDAATGELLETTNVRLGRYLELPGHSGYFDEKRVESALGLVTAKATPAGRWRFDVRTASGQRGSLPFTVAEGQPPFELRLALPMPGTVLGRLRFVDATPPANVTLHVQHANLDASSFVQFRYPGRWNADAASQTVDGEQLGTGSLRLQPAHNLAFRLDSADPTDDLVFTVIGDGIEGRATVRAMAGQTRELTIDVRGKR